MELDTHDLTEKMTGNYDARFVCNENTDIVLEGFPRSGNTFSVDFIRHLNNDRNLAIAHHTHNNTNLILGICFGVPCVALIRNPVDAITSYMIYSGQSVEFATKQYYDFYNELLNHKDYILFVKFDDVVVNMNSVINKINQKYSMKLELSTNLAIDNELVKNLDRERAKRTRSKNEYVRTVGAPTEEREILKQEIIPIVSSFVSDLPQIKSLYETLAKNN